MHVNRFNSLLELDPRMPEFDEILSAALSMVASTSLPARDAWLSDLDVSYKLDGSSLTSADLSIETSWRESIRKQFPAHAILGEEFGPDEGRGAYTWVLDPIDGTRQFGTGLLNFSSLVSVCRDGVPVIGIIDLPLSGVRYLAAEDRGTFFNQRSVRSSATSELSSARISLANPESFQGTWARGYRALARAGRLRTYDGGSPAYGALSRGLIDICLNGSDLDAYDICALCPIVSEAGGMITDWLGKPLDLTSKGAIVASATEALHEATLEVLELSEK